MRARKKTKTGSRVGKVLDDQRLLDTCHARSIQLLKRNLMPAGILAATPNPRSRKRGYTAIFGRDAAVSERRLEHLGLPAAADESNVIDIDSKCRQQGGFIAAPLR